MGWNCKGTVVGPVVGIHPAEVVPRALKRYRWLRHGFSPPPIVVNIRMVRLYALNVGRGINFTRFFPNSRMSNIDQTLVAALGSFVDVGYGENDL